ncbi:uncharacterized protein YvpB [Bacillus oleivorans]|uniref:Uncharacterized protein YvpB n=1 Tax=Bacillus oleivorans TaxID=1448271 RepID=A0A285D268_9BACI|nr:C39 family peptidase [Bacillus oleivorans]SNX73904.1 uncharacterized protein YvpB [Bacillus oleivorans]
MKRLIFLFMFFPLIGCQQTESNHYQASPYKINYEPKKLVQQEEVKKEMMVDVPLIKQNPELKFGCEVTSTAMLLQYAGVPVNKMELYKQVKKDPDPLVERNGNIISWGNPADGFVGDMTGKKKGYAVFDQPIEDLVNQYLDGKAINFTNQPFSSLLTHVGKGFPIVIWTTGDYKLPNRWESWEHQGKTIKTPLDLHVVVLVGYDQEYVYLNDPLSGVKQAKVDKEQFIQSWDALEKRAVSYHE